MKELSTVNSHPEVDKLVNVLCVKTQSTNKTFFNVMVTYYFTKLASMMRCDIQTHDRGVIPVSMYGMNLAPSGYNKGFSTNIVEEQVIHKFKDYYLDQTFPKIAEKNLEYLAQKRSIKTGLSQEDAQQVIDKEFAELGSLMFGFDSGTTPALKQMRHKLLMANAGSLNLEIDEIAANLLGNSEVLTTYLELFDVGKVKQKLLKNTKDNQRIEEIFGRTPTNMMLFGTPATLLDGGKVEEEFRNMLVTGYARRCIFGFSHLSSKNTELTPEEIYDNLTNTSNDIYLSDLAIKLEALADKINFGITLNMSKEVSLLLIEYRIFCEKRAEDFAEYEEINKAEMNHRYFKALKIAGAYAFIDSNHEITEDNLYAALKLVEESGESFTKILTRPRNYEKLALYIAKINREVTHVDIQEDLPFYRGSEAHRKELMNLAIAWGIKNNISVSKSYVDDVEFIKGVSLEETDLDKIIISYSKEITENYANQIVPFDKLHKLACSDGFHYCAHHLQNGYRRADNCLPGTSLAIIDVDDGVDLLTAQLLLKKYKYLIYETKRSTPESNRFRVILPLSHTVKLKAEKYKEFMSNIYSFLPFEVDSQTNDIARKWLSHATAPIYNDGELLDVQMFMPRTKRAENMKINLDNQQAFSNLNRWFLNQTNAGNRNNMLLKFGLMFVDAGKSLEDIKNAISDFNNKLPDSIPDVELYSTIFSTLTKRVMQRDAKS